MSRGVRPLALLGTVATDAVSLRDAHILLRQTIGDMAAIPFTIPRADIGRADVGFAAAEWVIDFLAWSYEQAPDRQGSRIVGLLLGYSPEAIASHDAHFFVGDSTALSTSKSRQSYSRCRE